ncbi:MAG: helix-turn-helix transcriptional regulator [Verrucomicrobiota bacterium]
MAKLDRIQKLGKNIAKVRYAKKLTQLQTSELANVHLRHYQKIERGIVSPSFTLLVDIRNALRCPWEDLFKGVK